MNGAELFVAMLPQNMLLLGIVVMIAIEIAGWSREGAMPASVIVLVAASVAAVWLAQAAPGAGITGHLSLTPARSMAMAALIALGVPVLLMSRREFTDGEFPALLLSSLYGVSLLPVSDSFLTLFLGIEIMSMPVYAMIVLRAMRSQSPEAALKYLVLSGMASAMLLMGVSLLYSATGSMDISTFGIALQSATMPNQAAVVLIVMALFVKGAVVPMHAWAPDAYEAASVPVTAYMATVIKGGVLVAALRIFEGVTVSGPLVMVLAALPLISIAWGNLAAMRQPNLRRMIAYSSIAHAGYLFYAFLGEPAGRSRAVVFYIVTYAAANLLAFAVLPANDDDTKRDSLETLRGLYRRDPFAAVMIAIAMLSLSGLPPFPGFIGKFQIFRNVMAAGYTGWAVVALLGSYLGIYFYLRVIQVMFMTEGEATAAEHPVRGAGRVAGLVCAAATLAFAVMPAWLLAKF